MKHTLKITLLLIFIFICSQIVGLGVTNEYIDHKTTAETGNITFKSLPYNIARPEVEQTSSFIYIFIAILIGTGLVLLIIKFGQFNLWRLWFFLSVFITLTVSLAAFIPQFAAIILAVGFAVWKIFRPNIYVHNLTEVFIYGGLAAIFVPIMNMFSVFMLLILISGYDMYAVWKSKHMISMAKFQTQSKVFAGLLIPYAKPETAKLRVPTPHKTFKHVEVQRRVKTAVLGGGDVGFPLIFTGVVMKYLMLQYPAFIGFLLSLIVTLFATLALSILLFKAQKDKFYPAMPFITAGCFVGYGVVWLITLLI